MRRETVWACLAIALLAVGGIGLYGIFPKAHHFTGRVVSVSDFTQADIFNNLPMSRLNITVTGHGTFIATASCQGFYHIGQQVDVYEYDGKWDLEHDCQ